MEYNERLTPSQRELQEFLASGETLESLTGTLNEEVTIERGRVTVLTRDATGASVELELPELAPFPNLAAPLAITLANRSRSCRPGTFKTERVILRKFLRFLRDHGLRELSLTEVENEHFEAFRGWLNTQRVRASKGTRARSAAPRKGGSPLTPQYKKQVMDGVLAQFRRMRLDPERFGKMREDLDLFRDQDWKTSGRRTPVGTLTRPELKLLVRLCREDVVQTSARLRRAWAILDGTEEDSGADGLDGRALRELHDLSALMDGRPFSARRSFRIVRDGGGSGAILFSRATSPSLWRMRNREYSDLLSVFQPTPGQLFPFMLLFAIYFRYNASVLATAARTDFSEQDSAYGLRIAGRPYKDRSGREQFASWPATDAPHNPKMMLDLIERWTAGIRKHAPDAERGCLFLFRNRQKLVRSYQSDNSIAEALGSFHRRHSEVLKKRFQFRALRPTVIDLVHHLFDGDVVMAQHAGQHARQDTTTEHYLSDGARKRNDEQLVPALGGMQNWLASRGVVDARSEHFVAGGAASPGWLCRDPYSGSMIQESGTVPCRAYGRCVLCENGRPDYSSSTSYALNVKLRDAITRARSTMPEHAWLARWMPALDVLEREVLRSFPPSVVHEANLDIPDLPTVE